MKKISLTLLSLFALASLNATADVASAQKFADKYAVIAKNIDPAFAGPSAEEGKAFFNRELLIKGKPTACASCHTANPADQGKHIVTGKPIRPLHQPLTKSVLLILIKLKRTLLSTVMTLQAAIALLKRKQTSLLI